MSPNDTVIVFGTPRQPGNAIAGGAEVLVPRARSVDISRPDAGGSVLSGSSASGQTTWVTVDLNQEEEASVSAAEHADYLDVDLVGSDGKTQ